MKFDRVLCDFDATYVLCCLICWDTGSYRWVNGAYTIHGLLDTGDAKHQGL
jgi:hypothetical protein